MGAEGPVVETGRGQDAQADRRRERRAAGYENVAPPATNGLAKTVCWATGWPEKSMSVACAEVPAAASQNATQAFIFNIATPVLRTAGVAHPDGRSDTRLGGVANGPLQCPSGGWRRALQ